MMRCDNCHKEINTNFPDLQYNDWLQLFHYFQHEYSEDEITAKTYDEMIDALMSVKPWLEEVKE